MTAVWYRDEVLEPIVRLYVAAVGPTFVLMDDNARPHRAAIVDDYLESERIAGMAVLAYSHDLNLIENLWDARAISSRFPPQATLIELKTAQQEEWRLLDSAVVDHLIESMLTRCKFRIQVRGGLTYPINALFFHFMLLIFILHIILFKPPVCQYLITYKNLILFSFLNIIIDFISCINIYATFLPNFVSIKAVFADFFAFYIFMLNFWKRVYIPNTV